MRDQVTRKTEFESEGEISELCAFRFKDRLKASLYATYNIVLTLDICSLKDGPSLTLDRHLY